MQVMALYGGFINCSNFKMNKEQIIDLWKSVGWNNLNIYHDYLFDFLSNCHEHNIQLVEYWHLVLAYLIYIPNNLNYFFMFY